MIIVADQDMTHVEDFFKHAGELILKPGRTLTQADVASADLLLVRSVTKVNKELLQNTAVKFVGSAVSGLDHLDIPYLTSAGITFSAAEGCNSRAVVEYIICAVAALQKQGFLREKPCRVGVVGAGKIGRQVVAACELLGFEVVVCDPLRAEQEKNFVSTPLEEFANLELISFHTPLTFSGPYPTYHLVDADFLQRQKKNCFLFNTGRGAVFDFQALKILGQQLLWCIDVWEHEPVIDFDVLETAIIATPHIAGYSLQSKYRAVAMIYEAAIAKKFITESVHTQIVYPSQTLSFNQATLDWRDVLLTIYDPFTTTQDMQEKIIADPNQFDLLRKNFPQRHEFEFTTIRDVNLSEEDRVLLQKLGITISSVMAANL